MELNIQNGFVAKNLGILFALLAATTNALMESLSKKLVLQSCTPNQVILYRYTIQMFLIVLLISFKDRKFTPETSDMTYFFPRCAAGVIANVFVSYSFLNMSYFDSMGVIYGALIVTSIIIGRIWFLERMTVCSSVLTAFLFAGLVLCCQPTLLWKEMESHKMNGLLIGSVCSVAAGVMFTVVNCLNKKITDSSVQVVCLYCALLALSISGIQTIISKDYSFPHSDEIIWLSIAVALNSIGVCFFTFYAFQLTDVLKATLTVQLELPFSIFLEWAIFNDVPNGLVIIGVGIMVISVVLMTLQDKIFGLFRSHTYDTI
ncbi:Uncharacterised protein at_DN2437 [Pycnogonum litorale]